MAAERTVYCEDALAWLASRAPCTSASLVASLPDISEFPSYSLATWSEWFMNAGRAALAATPDNGVTIFYQSDIKRDGTWVDKSYLCQKAAEAEGRALLWHKIVCRHPAGSVTYGRPSYSHILCFSKEVRAPVEASTADVLPEAGEKTWTRGMGIEACLLVARFIAEHTQTTTVIHPFCGEGSMLAAANALGLSAIGIERSPKRAEKARKLTLDLEARAWRTEERASARS